jgi:hypothetical protein
MKKRKPIIIITQILIIITQILIIIIIIIIITQIQITIITKIEGNKFNKEEDIKLNIIKMITKIIRMVMVLIRNMKIKNKLNKLKAH